jgi:competence protein ComFC
MNKPVGCRRAGSAEITPSWLDSFLHLLYPERCLFCGAVLSSNAGRPLCIGCEEKYSPAGFICPNCGNLLGSETECRCQAKDKKLGALFALSFYKKEMRGLIHDLKYHGRRSIARPLGRWLGFEIGKCGFDFPDLVTAVPLHKRREQERGFNQSVLIARATAAFLNRPYRNLLVRTKDTTSQTTISRLERQKNLRGAFNYAGSLPAGATLLLIDDVYSTGSTMKEAAAVLKQHGATVYGAVIAYNFGTRLSSV